MMHKLNKLINLIINTKLSYRTICALLKIERTHIKSLFFGYIPCSLDYAKTIVSLIKKNRCYDYNKILKKYGRKGLSAIYNYRLLLEKDTKKKLIPKIKQLRKKGLSYYEIGKRINTSAMFVFSVINSLKDEKLKKDARTSRNIIRDKLIYKDFLNGMTVNQLAKKYKLSGPAVRYILNNKFNVFLCKKGIVAENFELIKKLRDKGLSWIEIASIFKVEPSYLCSAFRKKLLEEAI